MTFCYGQSDRLQQGLESWLCGSSGQDFSESYMNQQDKRHRYCLVESRSIIIVTLGNWHFLLITNFIKKRKFSTQVIYWKSKNHEKLQQPMIVSKEEMNEWIEQSLTHIKYAARTVSGPLKNTWPPQMLFDYTPSTPTRTHKGTAHQTVRRPHLKKLPFQQARIAVRLWGWTPNRQDINDQSSLAYAQWRNNWSTVSLAFLHFFFFFDK